MHRYLTNDLDANGVPTFAGSDKPLTFYDPVTGAAWEHADDDSHPYGTSMAIRVVTTPHGIFRACVRDDFDPAPPEHFAGCPVYRVGRSRDYVGPELDAEAVYGHESAANDGMNGRGVDLPCAVDKFTYDHGHDSLDVTDRWLRIFHGGSLKVLSSTMHQGGDDYVTYDTRAMREWWGQTGDMLETSAPEADEWQAYLDGEVYSVAVERAVDFDEDGEPDAWVEVEGPIYGHYGQDYALQAAEDMLHDEIEHVAGQMLPL